MSGALPRSTDFLSPADGPSAALPPLEEGKIQKTAPLSFSQQQMWLVCQFQGGTVAYNQPVAWRIRGQVDITALDHSLNAVVRRHEALRTTFPYIDDVPVQAVHRELLLSLRVVDLREFPVAEREQRAHELLVKEARYPFNLASELLVRAALFQTGDEDYIFVLTVHHIVCDGWSMGILIRELAVLYRARVLDSIAALPEVSLQYCDFSAVQREQLQGQKLDDQISYWRERLRDASVAEIPADRTRPLVPTFRGAIQPFALPKELTQRFKALCAEQGVFLFMGLLSVLQLLLHRYTGQPDIVVGAPVASRRRAKQQSAIGLFLNLIALRTDFSGDPSFRKVLKKVCDVVMGAYQHQDLPFERVVEEVHPTRSPGRSPLFQVTLDQVDPRWIALDLEGVHAQWLAVDNKTSKFDVTLAWFDSPEGLKGWLEYNTDIFDDAAITRFQGHYRTLMEGVIAKPDKPISKIALLTETERQQMLVEWNATQADYPAEVCIHDLFELQAQRSPQAVAIETESCQTTYGELNRRANQLAHYLTRQGIAPGALVGVSLERSPELMVSLLGILKTGASYVPLDPSYPSHRLTFMVQDSGLKLLLTQEKYADLSSKEETKIICLDREAENLARENEENPCIEISPNAPAYVIYTSGSTGQPKGVLGLHRGAVNRFAWMWNAYPFQAGEVACAKTSLNFVDSVWESFGPLLAGIKTALIPDDVVKSPRSLIAALAERRVTRLVLVPSLLSAMLDADPEIGSRLPALKYWISSGEALSAILVLRFRDMLPDRVLLNLYGSSEVSADVTCYDTREMTEDGPVLIGKPIANTQAYILDSSLEPLPIGVSGQLCVSGAGLAQGYLNRPEQTQEKFLPHSFKNDPTERLYLTGDLARYRGDGSIEILGRIDNQVKIRGVRVEPEEIELSLRQHSSVTHAVVNAALGFAGEATLVAYVVSNTQAREYELVPQLRQYLRERLPEHMVPAEFVVLPSLPLLPNGKIDRHSLPTPEPSRQDQGTVPAETCNPTEGRIRQVWQELLKVDRVGLHDNFFDLGGHSLLLAAVHNRLIRDFDYKIESVDLYRYPTINALAKHLDGDAEQRPLERAQKHARKQREILLRRRSPVVAKPE